jgi:transposase
MSIVIGVDQHRAQITAEWIDTASGEISRARVRPADRAGVRRFLARFAGQQLEVALEATTGWRFFVEELLALGAVVHLDITVYQSDRHRAPGHLSRQGPPALRWALCEAAQVARRPGSRFASMIQSPTPCTVGR